MDPMYEKIMSSKTPAMWVMEICAKQQRAPDFQIIDISKDVGSVVPRFKCTLQMTYNSQKFNSEGIDRSKKQAKHQASEEMLKNQLKLTPKDYWELNGCQSVSVSETKSLSNSSSSSSVPESNDNMLSSYFTLNNIDDSAIGTNPIGELTELCASLGLSPPEYQEKDRVGPPHRGTFECVCLIENAKGVSMSEKSTTKKQAKRRVAYKWLLRLKECNTEEITQLLNPQEMDSDGDKIKIAGLLLSNRNTYKQPCFGSFDHCRSLVSHQNHIFQKMGGDLMEKLKDENFNCDDVEGDANTFLEKLGQEEKHFLVNYMTSSIDERWRAIVSLTVTPNPVPEVVLFGAGEDENIAKQVAAQNALKHLQALAR